MFFWEMDEGPLFTRRTGITECGMLLFYPKMCPIIMEMIFFIVVIIFCYSVSDLCIASSIKVLNFRVNSRFSDIGTMHLKKLHCFGRTQYLGLKI